MFKYKTDAQLEAMSSAERDQYAADKREFEATQSKEAIDLAVKTAVDAAKKELEKEYVPKTEVEATVKTAVDAANTELKETVEAQGKKLVAIEANKGATQKETLESVFKEKYDAVVGGADHIVKEQDKFVIECKAIASTDIMSVNTVGSGDFPAAGSTGVTTSTIRTIYAKIIGFFGVREIRSTIMDLVSIEPLDAATLIAINETYTGNAEVTPECMLKPIVKMVFDTQTVEAEPVAAMWFTTTKLRRFFAGLVNRMETKWAELVNLRIPDAVNAYIAANATAFTPAAQLVGAPGVEQNNYDALGAVIASLESLGWMPNAIRLHPFAWRNMKQMKNSEGIYLLSNGGSISIVDKGIDWGGTMIPVIKDPTLGVDELVVGDMSKVIVGLDSELLYYETDGRTDAVATNAATGLARNIRTHVIEKFLAIIIPNGDKPAIVRDTFSNVKTLITADVD